MAPSIASRAQTKSYKHDASQDVERFEAGFVRTVRRKVRMSNNFLLEMSTRLSD